MTGRALLRGIIIIMLIVAANAVKPFSFSNVASQAIQTAGSFAIILPETARSGFDNANLLALALSTSWFSDEHTEPVWYGDPESEFDFLASAEEPVEAAPATEPRRTRQVRLDVTVHQVRQEEPVTDEFDVDDLLAEFSEIAENMVEAEEVSYESPAEIIPATFDSPDQTVAFGVSFSPKPAPVELPDIEPILCLVSSSIKPLVRHELVLSFDSLLPQKESDCDQQADKKVRIITLIEESAKRAKSVISSMLECEEEPVPVPKEAEAASPFIPAPQEPLGEVHVTQPFSVLRAFPE